MDASEQAAQEAPARATHHLARATSTLLSTATIRAAQKKTQQMTRLLKSMKTRDAGAKARLVPPCRVPPRCCPLLPGTAHLSIICICPCQNWIGGALQRTYAIGRDMADALQAQVDAEVWTHSAATWQATSAAPDSIEARPCVHFYPTQHVVVFTPEYNIL